MNFVDWRIFYEAAKSSNPYSVEGFFNPIQVAWVLKPTTFLPFTAWAFMMVGLSMLAVLLVCKKNTHWVWLSAPFISAMTWGSLDTLLLVPALMFGGVGLSLITMKPQIAIILVPFKLVDWWRKGQSGKVVQFFVATAVLWGVPVLIQPGWITAWFHAMPTLESRASGAASLAGLGYGSFWSLAMLGIMCLFSLFLILKKSNDFYLPTMFSPAVSPSYHMIAMESMGWKYCIASWAVTLLGVSVGGQWVFFLLPLFVWSQNGHLETYRGTAIKFIRSLRRTEAARVLGVQ